MRIRGIGVADTLIKNAQGIVPPHRQRCPPLRSSLQEDRHLFDNGADVTRKFPDRGVNLHARNFREHRVIHCCFSVGMIAAFGY